MEIDLVHTLTTVVFIHRAIWNHLDFQFYDSTFSLMDSIWFMVELTWPMVISLRTYYSCRLNFPLVLVSISNWFHWIGLHVIRVCKWIHRMCEWRWRISFHVSSHIVFSFHHIGCNKSLSIFGHVDSFHDDPGSSRRLTLLPTPILWHSQPKLTLNGITRWVEYWMQDVPGSLILRSVTPALRSRQLEDADSFVALGFCW